MNEQVGMVLQKLGHSRHELEPRKKSNDSELHILDEPGCEVGEASTALEKLDVNFKRSD
jgi:hypothetical protein